MLLHPAMFLFLFFLFFSIFMVFSCSSWFMAWMALEINMLTFIPMIFKKKNKYSAESALKYFLAQALASMLVIIPSIMLDKNNQYMMMLLMAALSFKVGSAPFHQWVPSLIEGMTWQVIIMFLILQKINPLILMTSCSLTSYLNTQLLFTIILFSSMVGCVGGLGQVSLRKIMVYSSITHLAWLITAVYSYSQILMLYYLIYSLILFCVLNILKNKEVYNLNHILMKEKKYSMLLIVCFLSIGGMPPFSGFAPKFIISLKLIEDLNLFLFFFLLFSTFLSLFFYMRVILTNALLFNSRNAFTTNEKKSNNFTNYLNMIILLTPTFFFIL